LVGPSRRPEPGFVPLFETDFFTAAPESVAAWRRLIEATVTAIERDLPRQPYAGESVAEILSLFGGGFLPPRGYSLDDVLAKMGEIVRRSVAVWHPRTVAHLHCPVLLPALAAEMVISALNQSMDSFDQAPAASVLEQRLTDWLCTIIGLPLGSGATFTSGGTQSNYLALLLARDAFSERQWGHSTRERGLHPEAGRLRVLCSRFTHFSIAKSAFQLGLGAQAIVAIDTDNRYRMSPAALREVIVRLRDQGLLPFAVVATAGTTDFGAIDPLEDIATIAGEAGAWLHVDAAYGGALLLAPAHAGRLTGLGRAASVAIDFHKAFYQPISCSALLLSDARYFELIRVTADYLNPEDHEEEGFPDLVNRSLATTRRFDALKLWMTFQLVGAQKLARMVDRTVELAKAVARHLVDDPRFEVLHSPDYGCVVFRLLWPEDVAWEDALNSLVPKRLFQRGLAVLGHTRIDGRSCLKMTILNPCTGLADLLSILDMIEDCARGLAAESRTEASGGMGT
jgi:L-2,4-diaminobutyrate decarboxylase